MLTAQEITSLLGERPGMTHQGKVLHLQMREARPTARSTPAQRALLDEMSKQQPPRVASYNHPASGPLPHRDPGPLTPIEQTWLSRLPTDPTQVSHADAQRLAVMAATTSATAHPMDRAVIDQVWLPVKEMHDRNAADVAVTNAEQPLPPIPRSALNALADAVAAENDQLRPQEAIARAGDILSDTTTRRNQIRDQATVDAHAQLEAVRSAKAKRTAVTA